ncbi:hypothetical protein H4R99_000250 [Coemansia sp. RSA 1722]|nr:hypothetical protein H4R99_000250 [Coemansia sp. RSA 1722]
MSASVGKEFLCKVRYQNPLPEVPFPPKLLPIPPTYVDPNAGSYSQARLHHYVEYRPTTLDEATPYPMYVDTDYGMPIDPCMLGAFDEDKAPLRAQQLDKEDEFLLNLPTVFNSMSTADTQPGSAGSGTQTPTSQTPAKATGPSSRMANAGTKRVFDHSVEGQLRAIEDSFKHFNKYAAVPDGEKELLRSLRHPTNSELQAVEAIPLFPDEDLWPNMYTVFSMDSRPEPEYLSDKGKRTKLSADERKEQGDLARDSLVFRPRVRQNQIGEDEQWIECFLPEDAETAQKVRQRLQTAGSVTAEDEGVEYRFEKSNEYDMPVRPASLRQDLYMFTCDMDNNGKPIARYVPVKARVMLKRRRIPLSVRQMEEIDDPLRITSLDLQLRDFSEDEIQERASAMNKLHEIIKEEIVRASDAAHVADYNENVDIGGDDRQYQSNGKADEKPFASRRRRRTPSYSSSPSP